MQLPNLPDNWLAFLGLGGGGYGLFRFLEFVLNWVLKRGTHANVSRKDLEDSLNKDRATLRTEMAELKTETTKQIEELRGELEAKNRMILRLERENMRLEGENVGLRGRYHSLINYMQEFVDFMNSWAERTGVPEQDRPRIPRWIHHEVTGPTAIKPPTTRRNVRHDTGTESSESQEGRGNP